MACWKRAVSYERAGDDGSCVGHERHASGAGTGSTRTRISIGANSRRSSAARPGAMSAWKPRSPTPATSSGARSARPRSSWRATATASCMCSRISVPIAGYRSAGQDYGNARAFQCPYHQWSYRLNGDLSGVPFMKGVDGHGGMPEDFDRRDHGLTKLRVATRNGAIFATELEATAPLEEYLGPKMLKLFDRVFDGRKLTVLGVLRQRVPANWKLMFENIKDPDHASLLHVFLVDLLVAVLVDNLVEHGHGRDRHAQRRLHPAAWWRPTRHRAPRRRWRRSRRRWCSRTRDRSRWSRNSPILPPSSCRRSGRTSSCSSRRTRSRRGRSCRSGRMRSI